MTAIVLFHLAIVFTAGNTAKYSTCILASFIIFNSQEKSEENERELDKKIDSIKKRNRALEKRHKEIERDKQLYA